jgi:hypothetical protein
MKGPEGVLINRFIDYIDKNSYVDIIGSLMINEPIR